MRWQAEMAGAKTVGQMTRGLLAERAHGDAPGR